MILNGSTCRFGVGCGHLETVAHKTNYFFKFTSDDTWLQKVKIKANFCFWIRKLLDLPPMTNFQCEFLLRMLLIKYITHAHQIVTTDGSIQTVISGWRLYRSIRFNILIRITNWYPIYNRSNGVKILNLKIFL